MTSDMKPLRVALAVEGATDSIMLQALITHFVYPRAVTYSYVQPEFSAAFEKTSPDGGWGGVYRWCRKNVELHGANGLEDNLLFTNHDLLIVQIDADVATKTYQSAHIHDPIADLPCALPCPPVQPTIDQLTSVLQRWLSVGNRPRNTVYCMPTQSLETWILAALYPADKLVNDGNLECRPNPDRHLSSKELGERLVRSGKKDVQAYSQRAANFAENWQHVTQRCVQATMFEQQFRLALTQ